MDTECDVDSSAGRGFNLSALYALLMLVSFNFIIIVAICFNLGRLFIILSVVLGFTLTKKQVLASKARFS